MSTREYTVVATDVRSLTDDEIRELNGFNNQLRAEVQPDDPLVPDDLAIARLRNIPAIYEVRHWFVRDQAGDLAATSGADWEPTALDNKHILSSDIEVLPKHRQRGIARTLLPLIVSLADELERPLLMFGTNGRVPAGEAFARRIGAEVGSLNRISRVFLADIDRTLIDGWVAEGPGRAPGYELEWIDTPYPEERLADIIEAVSIMNTAPRDDLDMEDWILTPEQMRAWEASMAASGARKLSLFTKHLETGKLIGFTEVSWNPKIPGIVQQMGTAVHPDHRGHALGKWLKAVVIKRLLDEHPDRKEIRTGNAESNDAMLGINVAIGFAPFFSATHWQVKADVARAYLEPSS